MEQNPSKSNVSNDNISMANIGTSGYNEQQLLMVDEVEEIYIENLTTATLYNTNAIVTNVQQQQQQQISLRTIIILLVFGICAGIYCSM